ncbi:uncharacterized protein HaLaN_02150 [Haematococcus lacustris]|uniref:Flagellar associated protein n=1 Tax=Haematococcus lacustris TaxID=44745 RepID=A0A699YWD6_HAELA|nr:uncharacterized protein HaLaN_02150 [Haematococcus lacustris]
MTHGKAYTWHLRQQTARGHCNAPVQTMTWNPVGSAGLQPDAEVRCGVVRPSMKTNPLLARAELGKVKPVTFSNAEPEHVFGYNVPRDPEGAREVTMIWKEHEPSPGQEGVGPGGVPKPNFMAMNKTAAQSGLTTAKQLPAFRASHMVTVKKFDHTHKAPAPLPSDKSPKHTYGLPSAHRTADTVRVCGPQEPPVKHLVQGAYQRYLQQEHGGEEWKLSKFKKVTSKVAATIKGQPASSQPLTAFDYQQAAQDPAAQFETGPIDYKEPQ